MVKDGEEASSQDKEKREKVDLKNQADLLCYQSEKQMKDLEGKIENGKKEEVLALVEDLRKAMQEDHFEVLKEKIRKLEKTIMDLGQNLYQENSGSQDKESSSSSSASTNDENVIDTDFTS